MARLALVTPPCPESWLLADACLRDPALWRRETKRPSWLPYIDPSTLPVVRDPGGTLWLPFWAAYSLIASTSKSNSTISTGNTSAIDTSGANLLIACEGYFANPATPTLSDSKSNAWSQAAIFANAFSVTSRIMYSGGTPTVGTNHTFLLAHAVTACYPSLSISAWSGAAASPFDQVSSGNAGFATTTIQTGSLTPSENNELVIAMAMCEGTTNPPFSSIDGGFTIAQNLPGVAATAYSNGHAYLVQTTAAAANPTWTLGSAEACTAIAASFKAAADAGHPTMRRWGGVPGMGGVGIGNKGSGRAWG